MIRAIAIYPNTPGNRFDWEYYLNKHIAGLKQLVGKGLVRVEVDKGIATAQPGAPAPFLCMAHMYFATIEDMQKCMAGAPELMADIPNFTDIQPQVQVSEIL
jgi:uncharacterized protein (TIGR02118 family)